MLQRIMKNVIEESTTEQLTEMYYEFVKANSLRAAQRIGTGETLIELSAEVAVGMNARRGGSHRLAAAPGSLSG